MHNVWITNSVFAVIAVFSAGCVAPSVEERLERQGPVFGRTGVNYVLSSTDGNIDPGRAADVARTIGRYRRLNLSEAEKIQRLAQSKFDGFLLQEVRNLQPKFAAKKRAVRRNSQSRAASNPAKTAQIKREEETEIAEIDKAIRAQAIIAVKRRFGSHIAIPLKTRDNKPAVAISKISGDKVQTPDSAIELNKKPGNTIEHQGKKTQVVGSSVPIQ